MEHRLESDLYERTTSEQHLCAIILTETIYRIILHTPTFLFPIPNEQSVNYVHVQCICKL